MWLRCCSGGPTGGFGSNASVPLVKVNVGGSCLVGTSLPRQLVRIGSPARRHSGLTPSTGSSQIPKPESGRGMGCGCDVDGDDDDNECMSMFFTP